MAIDSKKQELKAVKNLKYLNKDFDGFRNDLYEYARIHFKDKIRDFSPTSFGGMMLDLPAYIGDVLSFYLDHQFQELDPQTAVEKKNIQKHIANAGIFNVGAAPATVPCEFTIEVPSSSSIGGVWIPNPACLPVVSPNTIVVADNGIQFTLYEDVDYSEKTKTGNLKATQVANDINGDGIPESFFLMLAGSCISGFYTSETFSIGSFEQFKQITLGNDNVTEIKSVYDSAGNIYYEVEYLTQDFVFKANSNVSTDNDLVEDVLTMIAAPYRYTRRTNLDTNLTTLTFGGGNAATINDDVIPDPTNYSVPLYGKKTFSSFSVSPNNFLKTSTLGIIAPNVYLTIEYRYGGGLRHNVDPGSIRTIKTLLMDFPGSPSAQLASNVRRSISVDNLERSSGGENVPTIDDLKAIIPGMTNSQSRNVTTPDLIARIYSMPSNFGRVFRISVRPNPNNPLAAQIFIISRDANNNLIVSPDTLKKNLKKYLNVYRMISDAADILDAQVINIGVEYNVTIDPSENNKHLVIQTINKKLQNFFNIKNFQIDEPISLSDLHNLIFNTTSVTSVDDIKIKNIVGNTGTRTYSNINYNIKSGTYRKMLIPPTGGIFEIRYPDYDIMGNIV